eukprot:Pompholyxophrys_sp_v1_NODE_23_length_3902_cov_17.111256.p1 type:complete len:384 gc:universal NODE_23_length_3902_cov_17.111256:2467-1316(-)
MALLCKFGCDFVGQLFICRLCEQPFHHLCASKFSDDVHLCGCQFEFLPPLSSTTTEFEAPLMAAPLAPQPINLAGNKRTLPEDGTFPTPLRQRVQQNIVYSIIVDFFVKLYSNQKKSEETFNKVVVECENVDDFKKKCFDKMSRFIKGKFSMVDGKAIGTYLGAAIPRYEEYIGNLQVYNLKTKVSPSPLEHLQRLKNTESTSSQFAITVYPFGPCVKEVYAELQKVTTATADRAGSATHDERQQIADLLIANNSGKWVGKVQAAWHMWAGWILRQKKEDRERLLLAPPPNALNHLFHTTYDLPAQKLKNMEMAMAVCRQIIAACRKVLIENHEKALAVLQNFEETVNSFSMGLMDPEETSFSAQISQEIEDCEDVEHADIYS